MAISQKSIKILWAAAGGKCSFPDCWERLCLQDAEGAAPYTIGEMAHIRGDRPGSNRHDEKQVDAERNDYSNLILMCPTHHRLIDQKENEAIYTVETLHEMKRAHENKILERLDDPAPTDKHSVASEIFALLEENRHSWEQFGPASNIALNEPHNEAVQLVWQNERLSTITPNNRKISNLLRKFRKYFDPANQELISSFLSHTHSYELWVQDKIPYAAVVRFPVRFKQMIENIINARI